jgi:hypothetical protein
MRGKMVRENGARENGARDAFPFFAKGPFMGKRMSGTNCL